MGSVVLSLDAALAWGLPDPEPIPELRTPTSDSGKLTSDSGKLTPDSGKPTPDSRVETARESWVELLDVFDEFEVPATWAVVGHLLLDSCDGDHADHPTPTRHLGWTERSTSDGWFASDPGTWEGRDQGWYGSKLVDAIEDADVDHEVGSHTFSHVDMSRASREVASAEIRKCVELAEKRGLAVKSVSFPGNNVGHRDVLAAYGVKSYRSTKPRRWYDRGPLGTAVKLFGWPTDAVAPTLVTPEEDDYGLVEIPASLALSSFDGWMREATERVTEDPVVSMATRGIDRAATENGVFHLWLRVNDLTDERDFDRLRAILDHLTAVRERTALSVETMGEIAADVKDDEPLPREPIGPR